MKCIQFKTEPIYINEFIKLPKILYDKKTLTEDESEIKKFLTNTHVLSKYFKLYKFLIYDENELVGRFTITKYPNDSTAYLGFFECTNDTKAAKFLFTAAEKFARKNNFEKIVGPVDASFWHKYRLKINLFNKEPYTGEPYNKDYYLKLFQDNNYNVIEHYTSNIYKQVEYSYINDKYKSRYEDYIKKGIKIISPDMNNFNNILEELYYLLTNLYSDFPIYKNISKEDFISVFSSYKKIINPSMVKLAYKKNKLVGFFISVPNYNNKVYNLSLTNILKILCTKKKPKEYVMLYMGVDQEHKGLGSSLVYSIINELKESNLPSIGALARDGKVSQNYAKDLIETQYEYVLLEKNLMNINDLIIETYKKFGKKNFVYEKQNNKYKSITYKDFITKVTHLAKALINKKLKDKNILIYSKNSKNYMIADLAIISYVGTTININEQTKQEELETIIKELNIDAILYDDTKKDIINDIKDLYPKLKYINIDKTIKDIKDKTPDFNLENKNHEICSKIVFSSGTTSNPKGAMLSLKNILSGYIPLQKRANLNDTDTIYLFLPLHHTYANIYNFIYGFISGLKIYLSSGVQNIAQELQEVKPTIFCAVPLVYKKIAEASSDKLKYAFGPNIRRLFCGGAKFDKETRKLYKDNNLPLCEAYALTETASSFSIEYLNNDDYESVGTIFENINVKIINEKNGVGDIVVKGDNVFIGYVNNDKLTKESFTEDGYFITGDIGYIKDNKLYLTGRKETTLIGENGENIYPKEIENKLKSLSKNILKVKVKLINNKLTCDIYLNKIEDITNIIDKYNKQVTKKDIIKEYKTYDKTSLSFKE